MQPQATTEITPEGDHGETAWFKDHYRDAPQQIIDFLAADGVVLEGRLIADVGCGDGLIDLGLSNAARPAEVIGFDLEPTDVAALDAWARRFGVPGVPPQGVRPIQSTRRQLPAPDGHFDVVVSWSADSLRGAHLKGITVDELQSRLLAGGPNVTKVELITQAVHASPRLARYPLTSLAISGVKLIACPAPSLG